MNMIFLVDGDNNIGTGLKGADQLTADDSILVFYQKTGLALSKIKELCRGSRAKIQYLESVKGGKNSIDFQIITELGVLVGRGEADCAYVISQDKGYEAAMSALRVRYSGAFREVALRPSIASCLRASFLLRAATPAELSAALRREFGEAQGAAAYQHLEELFRCADAAEPDAPARSAALAEAPAADKPAAYGPENGAGEADRPAAEGEGLPAAQPALDKSAAQPAAAAEGSPAAPEDTAQPDGGEKPKTARTHRGGRRKKKPAEKAAEQPAEPAAEPASAAEGSSAAPKDAEQPDGGERPKTTRAHRGGRRKKPAEKTAEQSAEPDEPAPAAEGSSAAPEDAVQPDGGEKPKTARAHRGGRRKKKPAERTAEEA